MYFFSENSTMKVKFSLLYLSICFGAVISMSTLDEIDEWENFKIKYKKTYDGDEESASEQNFKWNLKMIEQHNERYKNKTVSYKLGINRFADWNETMIKKKLKTPADLTVTINCQENLKKSEPTDNHISEYFNWNSTFSYEVKDEGSCNGDWAFTAAGILEGYAFNKTGIFTPVSVQDIIDCSRKNGNNGCGPGYIGKSIYYVEDNGIASEVSYPFRGERGNCSNNVNRNVILNHSNIICKRVTEIKDEERMIQVLRDYSPIAVKIFAPWKFFFYKEGIFTGEDCQGTKEIDYNILIVGYINNAEQSWIVRNWLGKDWGEQGYARIARGKNTCEIASKPRIVTDKDDNAFRCHCDPGENV